MDAAGKSKKNVHRSRITCKWVPAINDSVRIAGQRTADSTRNFIGEASGGAP